MANKPKTFADCSIYGKVDEAGFSTERALVSFIMSADRIDISSSAFKGVVEQLKSRAQVAVVVRMLQQGNVVLGIANKELSPSLKVFYAKDIKAGSKSKKVFVDVTGIITLENGFFVCKNIDRFAAYLLGVMIMLTYYTEPQRYITNGALQKNSITAFIKLYCAILNDLRMPGYINNKAKIQYMTGVYFANSVMGLELQQARAAAANCLGINRQEANALDFYYSTDDLRSVYTFTDSLIKTFKLKDLSTDGLINKWIYAYGKGTMYALELYPAFLTLVMYAYSGSYINNMKRIENVLSKELVEIANIVLRVGNDTFSKGFKHESADSRDIHEKRFHELMEAHNIPMSILSKKEDGIDPEEISKEGLKSEEEDQGPKTPEEADTLVDELKKDSPMTEGVIEKIKNKKAFKDAVKNAPTMKMSELDKMADDGVKISKDDDDDHKPIPPMPIYVYDAATELDPEEISKEAVKSEDDKLPATNDETKQLEDDIVEDVVLK